MAEHVASWSKDPSTKVGAVFAWPNRTVAALGYNGFPRGVGDLPGRLADRGTKYDLTVHAEANGILSAPRGVRGAHAYCPVPPCARCVVLLVQAGVASFTTWSALGTVGAVLHQWAAEEVAQGVFPPDGLGETRESSMFAREEEMRTHARWVFSEAGVAYQEVDRGV